MQPFSPISRNEPPAIPPSSRPSNGSVGVPQSGGVLSNGVSIKGSVKFSGELVIDGEVEGSIETSGRLTVGKNAHITGEIRTGSVTVFGTVDGDISAVERCELHSGCTLRGDIEAPRLVVDEDATFLGSAKISSRPKPSA
jgi:cytoskeletal protein CcmA (bactofilin family)